MKRIFVPTSVVDELVALCRERVPMEACGFLIGVDGVVSGLVEVRNLLRDDSLGRGRGAYVMDPVEQVGVVRQVAASKLQTIAVWHSHPAGFGRMSDTDVRFATDVNLLHVVVGLRDSVADVRCWQLGGTSPVSVDIVHVNT